MNEEELLWSYLISKDKKILKESCVALTMRKDNQIKQLLNELDINKKRMDKIEQMIFDILNVKTLGKKVVSKLEDVLDVIELMGD